MNATLPNGMEREPAEYPQVGVQRSPNRVSDLIIELTPVERILCRTPMVAAGEYKCRADHPQFRGGGPEACPYIVFSRSSVRLLPNRGPAETCTPVTVNLLDVGDSYERQAVGSAGADCDWIAVSPTLLREIAAMISADQRDRSGSVFSRCIAPISAPTYMAQSMFFKAIRRGAHADVLAVEEGAIGVVARTLAETARFDQYKADWPGRKNSRRARELVDAAKSILAQEYWRNPSLADIAARVHCSPAYLSRIFSKLGGLSLHEYQQQVRLRISLDLIDKHCNIAAVAAQLGFASHSHFSDVFRRRFGLTPGDFSRAICTSSRRAMSECPDRNVRNERQ